MALRFNSFVKEELKMRFDLQEAVHGVVYQVYYDDLKCNSNWLHTDIEFDDFKHRLEKKGYKLVIK